MLNRDSEIEVWSRFVLNLWYELNPRVRCAFGNVLATFGALGLTYANQWWFCEVLKLYSFCSQKIKLNPLFNNFRQVRFFYCSLTNESLDFHRVKKAPRAVINCYPGYFEPLPSITCYGIMAPLIAAAGQIPPCPSIAGITGHVVVITDPRISRPWIRLLTNDGLLKDHLVLSLNPR